MKEKRKRRNSLKPNRFISLLLTIIIIFTLIPPNTILASPSGNGSGSTTTGGVFQAPGVMLGIKSIPNTTTDAELEKQVDFAKKYKGKAGVSLDKLTHETFPQWIIDAQVPNKFALIARPDNLSFDITGRKNLYTYDSGQIASDKFKKVYVVNRKNKPTKYEPLIYKDLMEIGKFKENAWTELSYKEIMEIVDKKSEAKKKASVDSFVGMFTKTEDLNITYGEFMKDKDTKYNGNQDVRARYLDILITVNLVCGNKFTSLIKQYVRDKNQNFEDKNGKPVGDFVVVELYSVISYRNAARTINYWLTYPSYIAAMTNKPASKFGIVKGVHDGTEEYRKGKEAFQAKDREKDSKQYSQITDPMLSGSLNTIMYKLAEQNGWAARYSLMSLNLDKSIQTGGSGYSFFTDDGEKPPELTKPQGNIYLDAAPDNKVVKKGDPTTANIKINLKQSNKKIRDILVKVFNEQEKLKRKATLTITLDFESVRGSGASAKPYDKSLTKGVTLINNKIVIKDLISKNFMQYIDGKKVIELTDTDIKITEKTINKYIAIAELKWTDDIKCTFTTTGKGKYKKDDPDKDKIYKAFDTASWLVTPEEPEEEIHEGTFYSEMEPSYVEIKDNSPEAENFEAMAGVPTTEDLYAGFGATEFMLNMDVEEKESTGSRDYNLTYTCSQCIENDEKCIIAKSTHSHTCEDGTDAEGNPISKPHSYTCGGACPKCGDDSACPGDTHKCGHATGAVGVGCKVTQKINNKHPHSHTWKGKVTQPIDKFKYVDIKGLDLWQVNRLIVQGNPELFKNPDHVINPDTGYRAFYNQEEYKDKNGRLVFGFNYEDSQKYGNTKTEKTNSTKLKKTECDTAATEWMNSQVTDKTVTARVISDFLSLNTTEGYQVPLYSEYLSDPVKLTTATFATGSESKSIAGEMITFSKIPEWKEVWTDNPHSAAKWEPTQITRSGYNGNFATPTSKYNNTNITIATDPSAYLVSHPNMKTVEGSHSYQKNMSNQRMTRKGLNIIDSTDNNNNWSPDDGVEPISNGFWETGNCYIEADKVLTLNTTEGFDYNNEGDKYREEVTYSPSHDKVNDIVVHNPVSAQYATVITNPDKYDMRTDSSLEEGGDPIDDTVTGCPNDASCPYSILNCSITPTAHLESCYELVKNGKNHVGGLNSHQHGSECTKVANTRGTMHIASVNGTRKEKGECTGLSKGCILCAQNIPFSDNTYPNDVRGVSSGGGWYWHHGSGCSYEGQKHISTSQSSCTQCGHSCGSVGSPVITCDNKPNVHICTPECSDKYDKIVVCDDPHHFKPGAPWTYENPNNHYDFGDNRCYKPCGDDNKHKPNGVISLPNGSQSKPNDIFINIDRTLTVYYPDKGDFEQSPNLHGISSCTNVRGMGYKDGMNTEKWTRNKYVTLPVNVLDANSKSYDAGTQIDLLTLPNENGYYKFYAVLANKENINATVQYLSIANNAMEVTPYDESKGETNRDREWDMTAPHTAAKRQLIDVVGYIGSLTLNDTGDFRFATLFKQLASDGGWLIENLVPRVNYKLPNTILSDDKDVRQEIAKEGTMWHSPYQVTEAVSGGKAHPYVSLPLTPGKNPIQALRKQPMRPGYQLYMDVETVGNYYGENVDNDGNAIDKDMYYKMQITPRYWELNLDTREYTPIDVYMGVNGEYEPVVKFGNSNDSSEWIYYLDWLEESARRNYTTKEKEVSNNVVRDYSINQPEETVDGITMPGILRRIRLPLLQPEAIGTANRLFLNDLNRTFIGSSTTYGNKKNPDNYWNETYFSRQSQRWQYTLGLPSSSVFVKAGEPCTDVGIKEIQDHNSVIICAINIKVKGEVWTLEYNGNGINNSDGGGFRITEGGSIFTPPIDPDTRKPLTDPIITIYSNKFTAKNDLRTEGSH